MKHTLSAALYISAALLLAGTAQAQENPFAKPSTLPYQAPRFDQIKDAHYQPAFDAGMKQHLSEIEAIAGNKAAATFDNTIVALERSGRMLDRTANVFFAVNQANSNPALEKIEAAITDLEGSIKSGDKADIEAKTAALSTAAQKLGEKMYADMQAQQAGGAEGGAQAGGADASAKADDVVDADFKEVKDAK